MAAASATARADASCRRCNRRKKRCDRMLPECEQCCHAGVPCSFLNNDRQVGSFSVTYVQNLERRVKELESQLASTSVPPRQPSLEQPGVVDNAFNNEARIQPAEFDASTVGQSNNSNAIDFLDDFESITIPPAAVEQPNILVDGIKVLSLQATAERYLGSSSGMSFAKLTQSILQRLSPDKADLVFGSYQQDTTGLEPGIVDPISPGLHLDASALLDWNESSQYPASLFGPISLSYFIEDEPVLAELTLPDKSRVTHLVDFYFAHSHTLYPIIRRDEFMSVLRQIYANSDDLLAQSPIWLFRIWMVLAVGSTASHTITLVEESESVVYYNKAMLYFEAAVGCGDVAALEVLMLQVSYSFFNQIGPNTWFLVGIAARIATGIGLHTASTYKNISVDIAEYRKRLFYSLYMMDRVVSVALGRPFAIHDSDIDIDVFSDVDDENVHHDKIVSRGDLQPSLIAVPLHILALRQIASEIAEKVYSKTRTERLETTERESILEAIHKKLINWRRDMPFPLPDVDSRVPHLSTNWYDLNYYTHLTLLYRPSPLFPTLDQAKISILTTASSMSLRQAMNLYRQQRFAFNWLNLLSLFISTMSLIYATTAGSDDLATTLMDRKVIEDLGLTIELLELFSTKFSAAVKFKNMVQEIQTGFKTRVST